MGKRKGQKVSSPSVMIIMGSETDQTIMREAAAALSSFKISYEMQVVSAHRTPELMYQFAQSLDSKGVKVVIAGAGGAAHLPGMVASLSTVPVVGVPISVGTLGGQDALLSIVQMPKGVPVATVGINQAFNAGLLTAQILSTFDPRIKEALKKHKMELKKKVLDMRIEKTVS